MKNEENTSRAIIHSAVIVTRGGHAFLVENFTSQILTFAQKLGNRMANHANTYKKLRLQLFICL